MKTKTLSLTLLLIILIIGAFGAGYRTGQLRHPIIPVPKPPEWGPWSEPVKSDNSAYQGYLQFRQDTNTGLAELRLVEPAK